MALIDLLPLEPPAELMEKVRQHKAMHQGWLVYKCAWIDDLPGISKMRVAQVHCTECNSTYNLEWTASEGCRGKVYGFVEPRGGSAVWSRSNCLCPQCGADCRAMHVSEFDGVSVTTMAWLTSMSFHRVGNEFAVCTWHTERHVDKEGRTSFVTWPNEAYYTDGKALRKAVGYMKFMYSTFRIKHWEERVRCSDTLDSVDMWILPTESDLAGTMLENAKVIEYIRNAGTGRLIGYMKLYQKHKRVENLITAGLARLVHDEIYWRDDGLIDWSKKRPGEMLGMTRGELRYFSRKIPSNQYREGLKKELASATKEKVIEVQPTEAKPSEAEIKAIKKEAAEKAKAKAEKLIAEKEQELAKAKADAELAQAAADRERSRAEQLEKELRAADPAVAQFKGFFTAFQEAYLNCKAQVEIIGKEKPEVAEKLRAAMMAVMQ